jgi:hypothetical protein
MLQRRTWITGSHPVMTIVGYVHNRQFVSVVAGNNSGFFITANG